MLGDARGTSYWSGSLRETFTMYSRPSAFGPPVSGRHDFGETGSSDANSPHNGYSRQLIADSILGVNPSFTPPYYDGEAWCDVLFHPSSSFATLSDILAASKKLYWRFDKLALGKKSNNTHPYGNLNINNFSMQLSSSFNLFQKVQEPNVTFDAKGNPISIGSPSDETSVWVIQPKFETPMFNFNDVHGVRPLSDSRLVIPVNNSESIARGMWHQFGTMPADPQQGIFLDIETIPQNFIKNRVHYYNSSSIYADQGTSLNANADKYDDTNIQGFYGGEPRPVSGVSRAKAVKS